MEDLLHYVWKHKLFVSRITETVTGEPVEIIDTGTRNVHAGPDFFNAKIKIGKTLWAGSVEIHTHSSDWYKHGHDKNPQYNSVILHVVKYYDREVFRLNGEPIPQLLLSYPELIDEGYEYLLSSDTAVPCSLQLSGILPLSVTSWLNALTIERLEQKTERIFCRLKQSGNNWEEVMYVMLGRYFGGGVNTDAFERLTRSLPYIRLLKHKDSLFRMEALLFGQAGMLSYPGEDDYFSELKKEYDFLRHKYKLQPIDPVCWKSHRLRPANFPELRIAQFAAVYHRLSGLFSRIMKAADLSELHELFKIRPSDYWNTHYSFGTVSPESGKSIGNTLIDALLINVVIPVIFSYGITLDYSVLTDKAFSFLEELPPENNSIIREWAGLGLKASNAGDSQALIHLKKEYCEQKKCLYCRIGREILADKNMNHKP
ncbi:MAG: DUF2851 family protein [Candidatus Azobacteroides sp.]|nr:DUF2851 family protein [Candidatus Azobacteroides sp.]